MAYYGINFRASSGFVTDTANNTYNLGEATSQTRGGLTFQWDSSLAGNARDRTAGANNSFKLAGIVFTSNSGSAQRTLTITLPASGTYDIDLALGDESGSSNNYCEILDNTTSLITISAASASADSYIDASGVARTRASPWETTQVKVQKTFATTTCVVKLGSTSSTTGNSIISHIGFDQVAGGGGSSTGAGLTSSPLLSGRLLRGLVR